MSKFASMRKLVALNPVLQFAQKAAQDKPVFLSDSFSPTGVSFGMGQELGSDIDVVHKDSVGRHRLFLNMMKFNMQQRG